MVKIANPAYDVAFKYLMEDKEAATILLSDLIQMEIVDLEVRPKEYVSKIKLPDGTERELTLYRLDFKAIVRTAQGELKAILIEVQRASFYIDLLRFRRYLGEQYASVENFENPQKPTDPIPILTIYFLGYELKELPKIAILRVKRQYTDFSTGQVIDGSAKFVEALSHDMIIVQMSVLKEMERPKTETENVLKLFDPEPKKYYLWVDETQFSPKYKTLLKRLEMAAANNDIVRQMQFEDEITLAFRILQEEKLQAQKEKQEAYNKMQQAFRLIEQERLRAMEERRKAKEALKRERQIAINTAKALKAKGFSIEEISQLTGLSEEEIKRL